jgi:hypothetical protein
MNVINGPPVPYWGHIPDGLNPGTVIQIDGSIPYDCSEFELNLMCGYELGQNAEKNSNIALQLRPKIQEKTLICNSRQYGNWGYEEKHPNIDVLYPGSTFNITIIVEHQYYRIICNGQNICNIVHRLPYNEVRVLNIGGHVNINRIEYRQGQQQSMPSAPYPTAPAYPTTQVYPSATAVYPPPASYPAPVSYAPPVYVPPPVIQPMVQTMPYVPPTVVIESGHHHGHHGIIDTLFGHHDHHHHGYHHHGHHHHHH